MSAKTIEFLKASAVAGAYFVKEWGANYQWEANPERQRIAFEWRKKHGVRVLLCLEHYNAIDLDLAAKPIRDHEKNRCSPVIGYAGALTDLNGGMSDDVVFISNKVQTAKLCRAAGAWYQRVWSANSWWYRSTPQYLEELKAEKK